MSPTFSLSNIVGSNFLNLIITGIHTAPLSVYREYIQNAADSINSAGAATDNRVEVDIDIRAKRISIRDNGPGLSYEQSLQELLPIANSKKLCGIDRGFRGIGRLSGLGFAKTVTFLTRSCPQDPVTRICWDGEVLREGVANKFPIEKIITECVNIETIQGDQYPEHFFEVNIDGVTRHSAGMILNCEIVRNYISEVCPVPFSLDFPYRSQLIDFFKTEEMPFALNIFLNKEKIPITRRHGTEIHFSEDRIAKFIDFEKVVIPTVDGNASAAIGWIAHSSYLGALPMQLGIRSVRARVGNIQIGDETLFDHLFSEERFNRWCVAEIHILEPRIIPNGRRDYFEPNPHTRNLENHLSTVFVGLEKCCRMASKERNQKRKLLSSVEDIAAAYKLATSKYLTGDMARKLIDQKLTKITSLKKELSNADNNANEMANLNTLEKKLKRFRVPESNGSFAGIPHSEVKVYRKIFCHLAEIIPSPNSVMNMIEDILVHIKK